MANFWRVSAMAVSLVLLTAPNAACAHKEMDLDCQVDGTKFLNSDLNEAQLCARFIEGLGDAGRGVAHLHIIISQRGGIAAQWTMQSGGKHDIALDVMDRALKLSDLDRLAADARELKQ